MASQLRVVHLADLHLGYTGPQTLVMRPGEQPAGRFVREVDIELAVSAMVRRIVSLSPKVDVVIIAGDLFHRANPLPRPTYVAAWLVKALVDREIEVVIVDGNHDMPPMRIHSGSPLEYLKTLGAHVVFGRTYEVIGRGDHPWSSPVRDRLNGSLAVHCVPYRAVYQNEFNGVAPLPDLLNVLAVHGRVGGAPEQPETNTLGIRPAVIPSGVLRQGWDYVALGDWHIHRFKPLADVPAFYAGSLEALTFGEASFFPSQKNGAHGVGGAIDVRLERNSPLQVSSLLNERRRPVLRLKPIEAQSLDAAGLLAQLRERITDTLPPEALVRIELQQCRRDVWQALDHAELSRLRERVRQCNVIPTWQEATTNEADFSSLPVEDQWETFVKAQVSEPAERQEMLALGRSRIDAARQLVQEERVAVGQMDAGD